MGDRSSQEAFQCYDGGSYGQQGYCSGMNTVTEGASQGYDNGSYGQQGYGSGMNTVTEGASQGYDSGSYGQQGYCSGMNRVTEEASQGYDNGSYDQQGCQWTSGWQMDSQAGGQNWYADQSWSQVSDGYDPCAKETAWCAHSSSVHRAPWRFGSG